ncbi:hypothetical protein P8452_62073 [Trifolium repens]|nr:hypothetical protein P8452_62073 [Trifolium repens]
MKRTMSPKTKALKLSNNEERKAAEASGDTRAWNSLFMRPDTVVENVLGNMVLKAGVNVESLEELSKGKVDGVKRSNLVILVKNLPYGSTENELANMFGKFGSLEKIILPSTKTLALVVFHEPAEAKVAFRDLAYKRYKDAPLYLERSIQCIGARRGKNIRYGY